MTRPTFYKKKALNKTAKPAQSKLNFETLDNLTIYEKAAVLSKEELKWQEDMDDLCHIFPPSQPFVQRPSPEIADISYPPEGELYEAITDAAAKVKQLGHKHIDNKAPRYSAASHDDYADYAYSTLFISFEAATLVDTPEKRFVVHEVLRLAMGYVGLPLWKIPLFTREGQAAILEYVKNVANRIGPFLTPTSTELFA